MTDAFVPIDDGGFSAYDGEDIAFGADRDARTATDTGVRVNPGMLRLWSIGKYRAAVRSCTCEGFAALVRAPIAEKKEPDYSAGDEPCKNRFHHLL